MRIDYFREFIALSRTLNLTATAKDLNITQPAISNHMRALEKEVGAALFQRNDAMKGKASKMTPAGRSFLANVEKIVELYDAAKLEVRTIAKESCGKLVFRLPRSEMAQSLFPLIYEFQELYPNITVELQHWSPRDLIEELANGEIDCGCLSSIICEGELYEEEFGIDIFPFESLALHCVLSKDSLLSRKEPLSLADLSETPILIPANQKQTVTKYTLDNIFGKHGVTPSYRAVYCDSTEEFIATKLGENEAFLLDSLWSQWSPLAARRDCAVRLIEPQVSLQYCFASQHNSQNESLVVFKQFIREKFLASL